MNVLARNGSGTDYANYGKKRNLVEQNDLTSSKIDILQIYFGIALRQNVGNLENITNAIHTSLYHVLGYRDSCPETNDSWCQY